MKRLIGLAAMAILCCCESAAAALVVNDFKLSGVDLSAIGNPAVVDIVVRVSYDLNQPDGDLIDVTHGAYTGTFALSSGSDAAGPLNANIDVFDDAIDTVRVTANFASPFPTIAGTSFSVVEFQIDSPANTFGSDALPPNLNFAAAPGAGVIFRMGNNDSTSTLDFASLEVLTVPEASTQVLLIAGLAGMLGLSRMRRA